MMRKNTTKLLTDLRALMRQLPNNGGAVSAYIIPTDDPHQSEYISETDERRSFISGFDGSAGTAIVTQKQALLWTDGRYHQQAEQQLDENWTLMKDGLTTTPTMSSWLSNNLSAGDQVGVDGNLLSFREWNPLYTALSANDIQLTSIEQNLVDLIWEGHPPRQFKSIISLDLSITGKKIGDAVQLIRKEMRDKHANVLVVTALDEIAWLMNLRGSDIDYNPVFYSYVVLTQDELYLFVEKNQLPVGYEEHFRKNNVTVIVDEYENVQTILKDLIKKSTGKVWISPTSCYALSALIPEKKLLHEVSPVCAMKAVKNAVEAQGIVDCHIRDGIALCKYFAWLEDALNRGEKVDEISGATKLQGFREKLPKFAGLSFSTINGSGPNGAIIHYHPTPETNRPITLNEMYLCDSGAQFQ
ncbi:xaa-Pro aminopeptidase ApepP-like [Sitodiplosis mosellana]|uniref:xaa-Pro aminopeptidase ApepP-like n=1 Tax=Sitodiplosis mosellana TaxID=263140 RepID=UPI002443E519|nr:xaa-Pro aminopeptidase ApepP-like [Sitodiplosis mosellana]